MTWSRMPTGTRRAASPAKVLTSSTMYSLRTISSPAAGASSGREDAALDQLLGRVAGQQPRVRVQRVPAAGVVVDDVAQPRGELGEELLARQSPGAEQIDLLDQALDATMPCAQVSHAVQERSPRAGDGCRASRRSGCTHVLHQRSRHHDDRAGRHPRTHRPRARRGRAPLVLRRPDDDQGRRRRDRRPHDADRADRAARHRLAAARPPQRGRVVLRPRGRAHDLGRGQDDRRSGRLVRVRPARRPAHVRRQLRAGALPAGHASRPDSRASSARSATPRPSPEIPPAPTAPPDMAPVLQAAADHGLEILGPPGIPA